MGQERHEKKEGGHLTQVWNKTAMTLIKPSSGMGGEKNEKNREGGVSGKVVVYTRIEPLQPGGQKGLIPIQLLKMAGERKTWV